MATVLVHPSLGKPDGLANSKRTLERSVNFGEPLVAAALSPHDQAELLRRHPSGEARFWGTYDTNRKLIHRVHEGDVVFFTGDNHAWLVGVVGYRFDSVDFARAVWREHPVKGPYQHAYSLAWFQQIKVPYATINAELGYRPSNHFQGMTVLDKGTADGLVEALGIQIPEMDGYYGARDERLALDLKDDPKVPLIKIEEPRVSHAIINIAAAERTIHRGENALVKAYAATLSADVEFGRQRTGAGVTDLQVRSSAGHELIEAKSAADTGCVRQVLAQLLHYAPSTSPVPDVVSGLFPVRPSEKLVGLLHSYGVDVIHRTAVGQYTREPAPAARRAHLRTFWA